MLLTTLLSVVENKAAGPADQWEKWGEWWMHSRMVSLYSDNLRNPGGDGDPWDRKIIASLSRGLLPGCEVRLEWCRSEPRSGGQTLRNGVECSER